MGNNHCKRLGITRETEITTSMVQEVWSKYDENNEGFISKKQAMRFLRDFGEAMDIEYSDELAEECYSFCDATDSGVLTFRQFECLCVEAASNSGAVLSASLRQGDVSALGRVLEAKNKNKLVLDLSRIPMEEFPEELFELKALRTLRINRMGLSRLPPQLCKLDKLSSIRAGHNLLTEVPDALAPLASLTELDLSSNGIREFTFKLTNVRILRIEVNKIDRVSHMFQAMPNLQELSLNYNSLGHLPKELFTKVWVNLTHLSCVCNRLDNIPDEIGALEKLEDLNFDRNHIGSVPASIGRITTLKRLSLARNRISELPAELANLPSLQYFSCADNAVSALPHGLEAEHMKLCRNQLRALPYALPRTKKLDCSENQLVTEDVLWSGLTALQSLNFARNCLTTLPENISSVARLTYLDVQHNQLSSIPSYIRRARGLVFLNAMGNRISSLPSSLWELRNLNYVQLAGNYLSSLSLPSSGDLKSKSVQTLFLGNNDLPDAAFVDLAKLKCLQTLDVGYNSICNIPPSITELQDLTSLHLSGNHLMQVPEFIASCRSLKMLYLANNCIKSLPNLMSSMSSLQTIDLSHNLLHDVDVLLSMQSLKWIDIGHNRLDTLPPELTNLMRLEDLYVDGLDSSLLSARGAKMLRALSHGPRERGSRFLVSVAETQGRRSSMEDCVVYKGNLSLATPMDMFCVLDGHSGRQCAEYCGNHLVYVISDALRGQDLRHVDVKQLLHTSFRKVSSSMRRAGIGTDEGATAVLALFVGSQLYIANCGDSRAVLSRNKAAVRLSTDHKPSERGEEKRIREQGGFVDDTGRVNGIVGVSRSFGDFALQPYVIFTPTVSVNDIHPYDQFLILACDGVWDVLSDQEAVDLASSVGPDLAATVIRDHALMHGSDDNISVMVITLGVDGMLASGEWDAAGMPRERTHSATMKEAIASINVVGLGVFKELAADTPTSENVVVAPLGAVAPLSLLTPLAQGDTQEQLAAFLAVHRLEDVTELVGNVRASVQASRSRSFECDYGVWLPREELFAAVAKNVPRALLPHYHTVKSSERSGVRRVVEQHIRECRQSGLNMFPLFLPDNAWAHARHSVAVAKKGASSGSSPSSTSSPPLPITSPYPHSPPQDQAPTWSKASKARHSCTPAVINAEESVVAHQQIVCSGVVQAHATVPFFSARSDQSASKFELYHGLFLSSAARTAVPLQVVDCVASTRLWKHAFLSDYQVVEKTIGSDKALSLLLISPSRQHVAGTAPAEQLEAALASISLLTSTLNMDWIEAAQKQMEVKAMTVRVPRLRLLSGVADLSGAFERLGMTLPFSKARAHFEGAQGSELDRPYIGASWHAAAVSLYERSGRARAGRRVSEMACSELDERAKLQAYQEQLRQHAGEEDAMLFDGPFLVVLYDNVSGLLLFVSRVTNAVECV